MDTALSLLLTGSFVGADGFAVGLIVGAVTARVAKRESRAAWIAAAVLAGVVLVAGIYLVTGIRTTPRNTADAHAHDYSLAALWVAIGIWITAVNAVGAVLGTRAPIWWRRRRSRVSLDGRPDAVSAR